MLAWRAVELLDGDLVATKADVLPARRAVAMAVNFMVILVTCLSLLVVSYVQWLRRASFGGVSSQHAIKDQRQKNLSWIFLDTGEITSFSRCPSKVPYSR